MEDEEMGRIRKWGSEEMEGIPIINKENERWPIAGRAGGLWPLRRVRCRGFIVSEGKQGTDGIEEAGAQALERARAAGKAWEAEKARRYDQSA